MKLDKLQALAEARKQVEEIKESLVFYDGRVFERDDPHADYKKGDKLWTAMLGEHKGKITCTFRESVVSIETVIAVADWIRSL